MVLNVFEAVDVITLIKGGVYDDLTLNVGDALAKRADVGNPSKQLTFDSTGESSLANIAVGVPGYLHMLSR